MNVVILYGPPAVGKLTVAKALEALSGYPILHNHLLIDLSTSIFERGTPFAVQLSRDIRQRVCPKSRRPLRPVGEIWDAQRSALRVFSEAPRLCCRAGQ